jgi:glycosyltransferase involved in cell wall biosynthesis
MYTFAKYTLYFSFYEGFGLPILEASACGSAVIVSDIKVFREIAGNLVMYAKPKSVKDLSNKMKYMMKPDINKKYKTLAKSLSKKYSWKDTINKTAEVYKWVYAK